MSQIGLSTYAYAFFWRISDRVTQRLTLDLSLFQICDYPAIESWSDADLQRLRQQADALGITLEMGTRGLDTAHLQRYLQMAQLLDAHVVRSMFYTASHRPSLEQAAQLIASVHPAERGINQIIEHWLPWQEDAAITCQREAEWTARSVEFLRSKQHRE
ncbi:hypothetical protein FD733_10565 [Pantoea sp. Eser]|nr:hypothetical protein [Pantoea sp. Eser]